ncbi:MAG: phospholipase D-like domain-containing protein [Gemmatimonadota bacterium]|nr:phospholipase D-like domain-containing protein [Gemmatimonadota bacterium]
MMFALGAAGAALLGVMLVLMYWTIVVNADANRQDRTDASPPIADDPNAFLRALHGACGEPPSEGNNATLFQNGDEIFPAMISAIESARETVHFSTYVYWKGTVAERFAKLFCDTANRGITVRIVLDSEGAASIPQPLIAQMRDAGCKVVWYGRARWYTWMRYNRRTHRRLLIVDGTVGFTGGVGIADEWAGAAQSPQNWRDTHVRLVGPIVASLQAAFADNWNQCTDELLLNARDYPVIPAAGSMLACGVVSSPANGSSAAQRTMAACIAGATHSLHITNAYFVPTPAFVKTICDASARGVDVRIVVPGPHHDMPIVRHASWHVWPELLAAGVRIYEYQPTMIHCKTLTVDGRVSLIGSINFDPRSFALNSECAVVVADPELAAAMEREFSADVERCVQINAATLEARSVFGKARDAMCYWVRAQL